MHGWSMKSSHEQLMIYTRYERRFRGFWAASRYARGPNERGYILLIYFIYACTLIPLTSPSLAMLDSERKYIDLLFRVSNQYAAWDPELPVEVGDWGTITTGRTGLAFWLRHRGTFLKEGNIYTDTTAKKYGIPDPREYDAKS